MMKTKNESRIFGALDHSDMQRKLTQGALTIPTCMAMLVLAGCGFGSYTVGGTVSGLGTDDSVKLLNNSGDALTVSSNGEFTFSHPHTGGTSYDISVQSQTPGLACSISNGSGTIRSSNITNVAVTCTAGADSLLYSFKGPPLDGQGPSGTLIVDGAGTLYGTTPQGGTNGDGTVFKIDAAGTEAVLHSFAGGTGDGQQPRAGLIMDSAGNLYGTTEYGGTNNEGTVFKIDSKGAETVLHSFAGGTSDGQQPQAGLIMDSAGYLYGTTTFGGAKGQGTVFKVSAAGTENLLYSFNGRPTDGAVPTGRLVMDSAGNLYGVTFLGGANDDGTVFKISAAGTESVLYSFRGYPTDGQLPWAGLTMDTSGNLYGTTTEGGASDDGTVFEVSAAGAESVVYSFQGGTTDGQGPFARLIMDSAGNLFGTTEGYSYVATLGGTSVSGSPDNNGTVFKISAAGVESVLYSFKGGTSDGQDPSAGLVTDSTGDLYGTTGGGGANGYGTVFKIN